MPEPLANNAASTKLEEGKPNRPDLVVVQNENKKEDELAGEKQQEAKEKESVNPEQVADDLLRKAEDLKQKFDEFIESLKGLAATEAQKLLRKADLAKKDFEAELAKLNKQKVAVDEQKNKLQELAAAKANYDQKSQELRNSGQTEQKNAKEELQRLKKKVEKLEELTDKKVIVNEKENERVLNEYASKISELQKQKPELGLVKSREESKEEKEKKLTLLRQEKEKQLELWQKISEAKSFAELTEAMKVLPKLESLDGKVYSSGVLIAVIDLLAKTKPDPNSEIVKSFPNIPGIKDKVAALLSREFMKKLTVEYADHHADMVNKYYGIGGALRRLVDGQNYQIMRTTDEAMLEEMQSARAEAVKEQLFSALDSEVFLLDARAEAFAQKRGWGKKIYDNYKKLGKARLAISLGLLGGGLALGMVGAPLMVVGGVIGMRRLIGGAGSGVGAFDLLNLAAEKLSTRKLSLSKEQKSELDKFKDENRLGLLGVFSKGKRNNHREAIGNKKNELNIARVKEILPQMTDVELNKLITYLGTTMSLDGRKPTNDPVFMELLKEKHSRHKDEVFFDDEKKFRKLLLENQIKDEELSFDIKQNQREKIIMLENKILEYLKYLYYVNGKLFAEMFAQPDRPSSSEYARWEKAKQSLQEKFANFPPEVQTWLEKYSNDNSRGFDFVLKMLPPKLSEELKDPQRAKTMDLSSLNEKDWKFLPKIADELHGILQKSPEILVESGVEARKDLQSNAQLIESNLQEIENKKNAMLKVLTQKIKETDEALLAREKREKYMRSFRKVAAIGLGVLVMSGVVAESLRGLWNGSSGGVVVEGGSTGAGKGFAGGNGGSGGEGGGGGAKTFYKPESHVYSIPKQPVIVPEEHLSPEDRPAAYYKLEAQAYYKPEDHPHYEPEDHPHVKPVEKMTKLKKADFYPGQETGKPIRVIDSYGNIRVNGKPIGFVDEQGFRRYFENSGYDETNTATDPNGKFNLAEMKKSIYDRDAIKVEPKPFELPKVEPVAEVETPPEQIPPAEESKQPVATEEPVKIENKVPQTRLRVNEAMTKMNQQDGGESPVETTDATGSEQKFVYNPEDLPVNYDVVSEGELQKANILAKSFRKVLEESRLGVPGSQEIVLQNARTVANLQKALTLATDEATKLKIKVDMDKVIKATNDNYGPVLIPQP